MRYTRLWTNVLTLLIAAGVGIAALVWTPLVCFATVGLVSVFVLSVLEVRAGLAATPDRPRAGPLQGRLRRAVTSGGGLVALAALLQLSSPVTLALLLVLGLTSPPVTARVRRWSVHRGHGTRSRGQTTAAGPRDGRVDQVAAGPPVDEGADDLGTCEVRLLCLQLRRTFWSMHETSDPDELLRLVTRRQRIIDELTRRNPQAMATWLESGARASGSPEKYFRTGPDGPRAT
jgi:hypothetical protein